MTNNTKNAQILYIIRHGETEYNKMNMVQGSGIDSSLNEKGRSQALAFFEHYQHQQFDRIYTSTLKRTHQSVAGFIKKGINWEQHAGLNEISWGNREGRILTPQDDLEHAELMAAWNRGEGHRAYPDGESPFQVMERQKEVIDLIKKRQNENHLLICMHGRAVRILLCLLLEQNIREMERYMHTNLGLYVLEMVDDKCSILLENDVKHLSQIESLVPKP